MLNLLSRHPFSGLALDSFKRQLNISDSYSDTYLNDIIPAATDYLENITSLDVRQKQWSLTYDHFPCPYGLGYGWNWQVYQTQAGLTYQYPYSQKWAQMDLTRGPVRSIDSITYYTTLTDQVTLDPTTYVLSNGSYSRGMVRPLLFWPYAYPRPESIVVTFTTGMLDPSGSGTQTGNVLPESYAHAIRLLIGEWQYNREAASYGPDSVSSRTKDAIECLLTPYMASMGVG